MKSKIGRLFEVYDEVVRSGEHDLASVLEWVITAYVKKYIPIGVDAFERHVVETRKSSQGNQCQWLKNLYVERPDKPLTKCHSLTQMNLTAKAFLSFAVSRKSPVTRPGNASPSIFHPSGRLKRSNAKLFVAKPFVGRDRCPFR